MTRKKSWDQIAENAKDVRGIDETFIQYSDDNQIDIIFDDLIIEITSNVTIYERDLNSSLISAHPADKHGSAQGESGDNRGAWNKITNITVNDELTYDGRNVIRDSIVRQDPNINNIYIGDGSNTADKTTTSLSNKTGKENYYIDYYDTNYDIYSEGILLFHNPRSDINEILQETDGNEAMTIATTNLTNNEEKEYKIEIKYNSTYTGGSSGVFTSNIKSLVGEALTAKSINGYTKANFGTDGTDTQSSDNKLGNEIHNRNIEQSVKNNEINNKSTLYKSIPNTQPHDLKEFGISDKNNNLLWRAKLNNSITKDENTRVNVYFKTMIR